MLSNIIVILVATVLASAAGGAFGFFAVEQITHTIEEQHKKAEEGGKLAYANNEVLVKLPEILTNLAGPKKTWVRLEGQLVTEDGGADSVLTAQIAEDIVAYLRTVPLSSLEGASGFQALRANLKDRVRIRSQGLAKDLIIQAFIVE